MKKTLIVACFSILFAISANFSFAAVSDGMLLYYPFKTDGGQSVSDASGHGYTGTVNGPSYVTGVVDGAYKFDGWDDFILTGNMGYQPIGTISFWINADAVENWRNPFSTDYAGWDDCIRFEEDSKAEFVNGALGMGAGFYTTTMAPSRWYHIIYAWDAQNAYGYLDGRLVFTAAHPDPNSSVHPNIPYTAAYWKEQSLTFRNVCIGNGYSTEAERHWKGLVDEVRMYNRVVTAAEAKQLFYLPIVQKEADYILSCQYMVVGAPAYGSINDVMGDPTWIVPRENGMAILGLIQASQLLGDSRYLARAQICADYLAKVQDQNDGAWFNQYIYDQPHADDLGKSPTQTTEVMIAFAKLGFNQARYQSMKKGTEYLMSCQDPANKLGRDDGLLGGGKDKTGKYSSWRWTSDNSYAYWALKAAEYWAREMVVRGYSTEAAFADQCQAAAAKLLNGINTFLRVTNTADPDYGVWRVAVDENDNPQAPSGAEWINYAPQMLDLPATGVGNKAVGEWIHKTFQTADGACTTNTVDWGKIRKSPGFSFQASMCWLDLQQNSYADAATEWVLGSGLWYPTGGWIDWVEPNYPTVPEARAPEWLRFIDTSFYTIAALGGGYDFRILDTSPPSTPVVKDSGIYTSSTSTLSCSWQSSDTISGVAEYQYKITRDSTGGSIVRSWTSTGTNASVTATGLTLQSGVKYYFSVKAKNGSGYWSSTGFSDGIIVDNTAPATPVVTDSGATTTSRTTLTASWISSDSISGVAEYQYQITRDSTSGTVIRNWTSNGTRASVTATGLSLLPKKNYFFRVKAKNGAGLWSTIGVSNGITVQ